MRKVLMFIKSFFTEEDKATRSHLRKMDLADIFISLLSAAIFGCLLFGWRAVIIVGLCIAVSLLTDFLWDLIFKKGNKEINFSAILTGFILGLTLSRGVNVIFAVAVSIFTTLLAKTIFRNRLFITSPAIVAKAIFSIAFFKAFSVYSMPFTNELSKPALDSLFISTSFVMPSKYLFFGLQSGTIGEVSEFLLLVGAMYLLIRKTINPIISGSYIVTSAVLSLIFGESIAVSLLGGGLVFAALFLTIDYGFITTPRYKRFLYGICCGALTFVIRWLIKTEGALLAVAICNIAFTYISSRNIKRAIKFIKKPDFKKLLRKARKVLGV